jgi:hypothetical protein
MLPEVIYQAVPAKLYFSLAADKAAHGIKIYSALVRRRKTTEKEKRETRNGRLQKIYFFCCCAVTTCAPCAVYFLDYNFDYGEKVFYNLASIRPWSLFAFPRTLENGCSRIG